jgi:hypothetical protein
MWVADHFGQELGSFAKLREAFCEYLRPLDSRCNHNLLKMHDKKVLTLSRWKAHNIRVSLLSQWESESIPGPRVTGKKGLPGRVAPSFFPSRRYLHKAR